MSEMKVTSCDGCDQIAPSDYCGRAFAYRHGWMSFKDPAVLRGEIDACSWECLATIVAATIAAAVDA